MTRIAISGRRLTVELDGIDRLLALRRRVEASLDHVVSVETGAPPAPMIASRVPGAVALRTLYQQSGRPLLAPPDAEHALTIRLFDERYERLVVIVDDPDATAAAIQRAVRAA